MFRSRDSFGTGYVLAIAGVSVTLLAVVIGASTIAAVGVNVPTELWAVGGALSGALVGILVPSPSERKAPSEESPIAAAERTVTAANAAADKSLAETRENAKARISLACTVAASVRQATDSHEDTLVKADGGAPELAGTARDGAERAAAALECEKTRAAQTEGAASGELAARIWERAIAAARGEIATQSDENGAEAVKAGAHAANQAAVSAARQGVAGERQSAEAIVAAARTAANAVKSTGTETKRRILERSDSAPAGRANTNESTGQVARLAAATVLAAQDDLLLQAATTEQQQPHDEPSKAAGDLHRAVVKQAAQKAAEIAPAESISLKERAVPVVVPVILFVVTMALGLLLALGKIHVPEPCQFGTRYNHETRCGRYIELTAQASSAIIAVAAATLGALIGIFVSRPTDSSGASAGGAVA
jgi:hypothetical protein